MAMPVFNKGTLLGFVANIVHHADVGGAAVGSMSGGLNEIYKEGLRIPLVRLYNKGKIVKDIQTSFIKHEIARRKKRRS